MRSRCCTHHFRLCSRPPAACWQGRPATPSRQSSTRCLPSRTNCRTTRSTCAALFDRSINLHWTQYLPSSDTLASDVLATAEHSFLLTIGQRDNERFSGADTARLRLGLVRKHRTDACRMRSWCDRSGF